MNRFSRSRTLAGTTLASLGLLASSTLAATAPAQAHHAADCNVTWGSPAESSRAVSNARLVDVRAGRHRCFDRLVVDLDGRADGYSVRYVDAVRADGSGFVVPLRGGARLEVVVHSPAYDDRGRPTYRFADGRNLVDVAGWSTFRQVAWANSFEGRTTLGLGVRARLPFRTFSVAGPGTGSRLVIDVAHHW